MDGCSQILAKAMPEFFDKVKAGEFTLNFGRSKLEPFCETKFG